MVGNPLEDLSASEEAGVVVQGGEVVSGQRSQWSVRAKGAPPGRLRAPRDLLVGDSEQGAIRGFHHEWLLPLFGLSAPSLGAAAVAESVVQKIQESAP